MNRLTRDEIIHRALDMADSPSLDQRERPGDGGMLIANAMSLGWLQEGIDYFTRKFPWGGTIAYTPITYAATLTLPTDYTLDVRNGYRILSAQNSQAGGRLARKSLQFYLSCNPTATGCPAIYVIRGSTVMIWPTPDRTYSGDFWYYQLPAPLTAGEIPAWPDDFVLIEYVRLRAKEWTGEVPPGGALEYAHTITAGLIKQGLGVEPESDTFALDSTVYSRQGNDVSDPNTWMGLPVVGG